MFCLLMCGLCNGPRSILQIRIVLKHHLANCSVSCQFPRRDSEKGFRAWDVQRQSPKGMGGAGNREGEMLSRLWLRTMSARNLRSINHTPFEAKRWHLVFPVNQTWAVGITSWVRRCPLAKATRPERVASVSHLQPSSIEL